MSQVLVGASSTATATNSIFFPDTNVIIGLIFNEMRFGGSNKLFLRQVRKNQLSSVILPTVQKEVNETLKKAVDEVDSIINKFLNKFLYQVALSRSAHSRDTDAALSLSIADTPLLEIAFDAVYAQITGEEPKRNDRRIAMYDWVESWILGEWSELISQEKQIDLQEFKDRLKQGVLVAFRYFDDIYQQLKLDLGKTPCNWKCDPNIEQGLKTMVDDGTDIPHIALAASCLNKSLMGRTKGRAVYVTNDFGVLKAKSKIEKQYGLIVTRPSFAYAYYEMNNRNA